jgi:hypothetical protein
MGKKKPAAKTAPPAPTPATEDLATLVLCVQQHQPELYEAIMARGREQTFDIVKATIARTLEKGRASIFEEGRKEGLAQGRNDALTEVASTRNIVSIPAGTQTTPEATDSSTQTASTSTANAVTQTAPHDETPTSPSTPQSLATSPLTKPAQPPSTLPATLTTTTSTASPASEPPQTPREWRHLLPNQPIAPQPTLQPLPLQPEPPIANATSPPTTAATPASTTPRTTVWATASTQTTSNPSETVTQADNSLQRRSAIQQTALCRYVRTRSSERVVRSTEPPCQAESSTQTTATTPENTHQAPNDVCQQSTARKTTLYDIVRMRSSERVVHSTKRLSSPQNAKRRPTCSLP